MKLITRDTDYALRAVCHMYQDRGRIFSVPELVTALRMPRPFLRKLLQELTRKRIIRSIRGKGGGFRLVRSVEKLSLADILEVFQGPFSLNECTFKKKACPNIIRCPIKKRIDVIEAHVLKELKSVTVGSLLKEGMA